MIFIGKSRHFPVKRRCAEIRKDALQNELYLATSGNAGGPGIGPDYTAIKPNRRTGCARLLILKSIDSSALRVKTTVMCESEHAGSGRSVLSNASRHREFSNSAAEFRNRLGRLLSKEPSVTIHLHRSRYLYGWPCAVSCFASFRVGILRAYLSNHLAAGIPACFWRIHRRNRGCDRRLHGGTWRWWNNSRQAL